MKRIFIIFFPYLLLPLLVACQPQVIGGALLPTPYDVNRITVVKFKDSSLSNNVLVSNYRHNLVIAYTPEMLMIDSISDTHVDCPFVPFREDYYVLHWRWMGGVIQTGNKTTTNYTYSCLDNVHWTDIQSVNQMWEESESLITEPIEEIYHFFIKDLDKSMGVYYDYNGFPPYDSVFGYAVDKRLPFLPERPLRYYSKDDIMQYIHKNDSIFDVYLRLIHQQFEEHTYTTIWNN